ncbi:hypothetical protein LCGC14_1825760 [marine sediment metagenome]|uniref:Uncharacterized protein n=1 Tax=marine sediment metagenome TaxID=412755 RepID=A0A0F9IX93_9ZZZZ
MQTYWNVVSVLYVLGALGCLVFFDGLTEVEQLGFLVVICTGTIIGAISTMKEK